MKLSEHSYELSDEERVTFRKWRRYVVVFYAALTFLLYVVVTAVPSLTPFARYDSSQIGATGDPEAARGIVPVKSTAP